MITPPEQTRTEPLDIATLHLIVPREDIRKVMGPSLQEVFAVLIAQRSAPVGPWFTHHRRRPTDTFDLEICVPVSKPIVPSGRIAPGRKPAMNVARTVHHGPYEGLAAAWTEFLSWIDAQGLQTTDDLWETYSIGPQDDPDPAAWRTELVRPLVQSS